MTQSNQLLKVVMFPVASLNLAFSIHSVRKVTKYTTVLGSGLNDYGVATLDDQEITVVDLHKRLFNSPQPRNSASGGYLIIAKNSVQESFGIVVAKTPTLLDLPLSQIRALPESYRLADTLKIATHVAIIPQKAEEFTIFILDADQLVPPIATSIK